MLVPSLCSSQAVGEGPILGYDFYTFTSASPANMILYLSPSLNQMGSSGPLRYTMLFDVETPQVVQYVPNTTGFDGVFLLDEWEAAVPDAVWD